MQSVSLFFSLLVFIVFSSLSTVSKAAEKDEVMDVVTKQLDAFKDNDFKIAYSFAHSGIKEQFTLPVFEQMVRGHFPSMLKKGAVVFGELEKDEETASIQVTLTAKDGESSAYQYILEKDAGVWRISAVIPLEISAQENLV